MGRTTDRSARQGTLLAQLLRIVAVLGTALVFLAICGLPIYAQIHAKDEPLCKGPISKGPALDYQFKSASLRRSACFGPCPIYSITVQADGHMEYRGERNVETEGMHTRTLEPSQIAALQEAFAAADYFRLTNKYDCHEWTDNPIVGTTYESRAQKFTIAHDHGCRSPCGVVTLNELERKFDEIVDSERFTGVKKRREEMRKAAAARPAK